MNFDCTRKRTLSVISEGLPDRPSGASLLNSASHSGGSPSMVMVPGAMAFTRTSGASAFASTVVNMITPAFEMECGMNPVQPRSPPVSAKLMITPSVLLSQGAAACGQKIGRAVHKNVETPELLPRFVKHPLDFRNLTKVSADGRRPPPELFDLPDRLLGFRLGTPVMDNYVPSFFGQAQRHGASQPPTGPGHQRHPPLQRKVHGQ